MEDNRISAIHKHFSSVDDSHDPMLINHQWQLKKFLSDSPLVMDLEHISIGEVETEMVIRKGYQDDLVTIIGTLSCFTFWSM